MRRTTNISNWPWKPGPPASCPATTIWWRCIHGAESRSFGRLTTLISLSGAGRNSDSRLLQLDQAPPDFPPPLHHVLDIRRIAPAHRARHRLRVLHEACQHLQQRFAIVEEDVAPH